jgi:hypothetical protein
MIPLPRSTNEDPAGQKGAFEEEEVEVENDEETEKATDEWEKPGATEEEVVELEEDDEDDEELEESGAAG